MVCHVYQQKNVFAHPEAVPGFPTLWVVVFIVVSDLEGRSRCVDSDGIADHHGLDVLFL
jgi:hypothetical protein